AEEEMATVDLGDERLDERAVMLLSALGNRPDLSIPAACRGRAEIKAPTASSTTTKRLSPRCSNRTSSARARMAEQETVLLVQDTSKVDLTRPEQEVAGAGDLD